MNENNAKPAPVNDGEAAPAGNRKIPGAGSDGSIPVSDEGISLTTTDDASNFNQEEDSAAAGGPGRDTPEK